MKNFAINILLLAFTFLSLGTTAQKTKIGNQYYQITVYNFSTAEQQNTINDYLQNAYLPALHTQLVNNAGVFYPLSNDTADNKQLYVIIPLKSIEQVATLTDKINADPQYLSNGKTYREAVYNNPPYKRIETILLKKFSMASMLAAPKLQVAKTERIYELRSYESATEKIFTNKVEMFNEGNEMKIFDKLQFNPVFYGEVIAGSRMPNLMYMTSFENMNEREDHWKKFGADADWKRISSMPHYQNNVSKATIILMKATDYSDY